MSRKYKYETKGGEIRPIKFVNGRERRENKMTDRLALEVEDVWRTVYPDALILGGMPSAGRGVLLITHTLGHKPMTINGFPSLSPLANNALYTSEVTGGNFLNFYEVMVPDIPGREGERSTGQIYLDALAEEGLTASASHFHWSGASMIPGNTGIFAVHHQNYGLNPLDFSQRTIRALQKTEAAIKAYSRGG